MTHSHSPERADGVGADWALEAFRDAQRAREAADDGNGATWSHLLVEATAAVVSSADETVLSANLTEVQRVVRAWRADLARRSGDARCLSICCNPDAAGFHNAKLALN